MKKMVRCLASAGLVAFLSASPGCKKAEKPADVALTAPPGTPKPTAKPVSTTAPAPQAAPEPAVSVNVEAIAQSLVNQSAQIREGDLVQVGGAARDLALLEAIALHVRKLGAHPLITLFSERLSKRMYTEVPAKYDAQVPAFAMKLAGVVNARILVEDTENLGAFADIPPERVAAVWNSYQPVNERMLKRNVKSLFLGNDLYPVASRAERFGMSLETLSKIFWDGVNADSGRMQATGATLKAALAGGKEVQVTHPNGTDIKMRIEARPVYVSDGTLTDEKLRKGGQACQVWLPAGEVYVAPVVGTAEGKVVLDRILHNGKEVLGLTLEFRGGKATSMTAKSGLEPLRAQYDAAGARKDEFAALDIGINPNVRVPPGSRLLSWVPVGTVSLGIGGNIWAGGDNNANFFVFAPLYGATVKVDNKVIVENGALKL
jgi:leucyl aminopeptidase (aminopeptidase T)